MASIMLVHGAWHGPWCWRDFAERLRAAGHDVHTVQLRGHDGPAGRIHHRVAGYAEDIRAAAAGIPAPVLVAHSMGGLAAQKYLETGAPAAGLVLMASVPPAGATAATLRFGARHPLVLGHATVAWRLAPVVATPALAREMLFTPDTPLEVVDAAHARLQDESYRAYLDMMVFVRARPKRVRVPVLVLGAEKDGIFSVPEVRATAKAYGVDAEIFPGMGHDMMLDTGWEGVADRVDAWARQRAAHVG